MSSFDALAAARARIDAAAGKPAPVLEFIPYDDLEARLSGQPLVKGWLEREQISVFYGPPGCGKTFMALDVALHVAAGWLGHRVLQGGVVYVAAEAGRSISNRVAAFKREFAPPAGLPFTVMPSPVDLRQHVTALVAGIRNCGPVELVVIDTVNRALAGGEENSSADMGALFHTMDVLRNELRCHILAIHHTGKDEGRGPRGHSLLTGNIDTEVAVTMDEDGVVSADITKQRDGPKDGAVSFRLREVTLGQNDVGDPVTSCVVEAASAALSDHAVAALNILKGLVGQFCLTGPLTGESVVAIAEWRRYCKDSGKLGKPTSFRMAWQRVLKALTENNRVDIDRKGGWAHARGVSKTRDTPPVAAANGGGGVTAEGQTTLRV
jgi:hypothetical protein